MNIRKLIIFFVLIIWPLGLFLSNKIHDSIRYFLPTLLLFISYLLYKKKNQHFIYPLILLPLIDLKIFLFPLVIFFTITLIKEKLYLLPKIISSVLMIIVLLTTFPTFRQNWIFKIEYEAKQEVLRNTYLYPNILMARIFQNKARIVMNKFSDNFFAIIDPGNYFFSFHPREGNIINQNLVKFPFMALIPIFLGLYYLKKLKDYKYFIIVLVAEILALTFVEIFDRSDFILWFPLLIIFIHGMNIINSYKKKLFVNLHYILLFLNSIVELARFFFIYKP